MNSCSFSRTTSTGQVACRMTLSATLPKRRCLNPPAWEASFNLKHLIIVNQNFTSNIMINILWYLLDKRVINKFIFDKKKQFVKVLDYDDRLSTIQESLLY